MGARGTGRAGWPQAVDTLPSSTVCSLTGLRPQHLLALRSGRMDSVGAMRRLYALADALRQPGGSLVIERELVTIPRLSAALVGYYADQHEQWPALLRQVLRHAAYLTGPADAELLMLAPVTQDPRVVAVMAATAALGCHRAGRSAPDWTTTFLPEAWDVLGEDTLPAQAPVEFASRGVLLHARHLAEPTWSLPPRQEDDPRRPVETSALLREVL